MFSIQRSDAAHLQHTVARAWRLPVSYDFPKWTELANGSAPEGFVVDHTRSRVGAGLVCFEAAKAAFRNWKQFDIGWVWVANAEVLLEVGSIVAVEARALGLWSVNCSRILYVIDENETGGLRRFGFGYGTTSLHVERGEERFLLEYDPESGGVWYDLLAVSQAAHWMARLAYPFTRSRQKLFARESHVRIAQVAGGSDGILDTSSTMV
jgi:uncharacterized protein (UPF0548 family)